MAPKRKAADAPPPESIKYSTYEAPEEESEGPDTVSFAVEVHNVANLPCDLETVVVYAGPIRETRSQILPASSSPTGWTFEKKRSIRQRGQHLYDDLAGRELTFWLLDVGGEYAVVGKASVSLIPLLHDRAELSDTLTLELTEAYHAKWFAEPTGAEPDAADAPPQRQPVPTTISMSVTVSDLVGPAEDRPDWLILTMNLGGIFGLPKRLTGLTEEAEAHPLRYRAMLFGEAIGGGALAPPVERPATAEAAGAHLGAGAHGGHGHGHNEPRRPSSTAKSANESGRGSANAAASGGTNTAAGEASAEAAVPEEELSEEAWRERQERLGCSVRFQDQRVVRYRGAAFVAEIRRLLNHLGGVWLYLHPEEKPPADPKKPNPPEHGQLARHFLGKVWVDLRQFIKPGTRLVELVSPVFSMREVPGDPLPDEVTFESSRSFARLALELSRDVAPSPPPDAPVPLTCIIPEREDNTFSPSWDAANAYIEATRRSSDTILGVCSGAAGGDVPGALELLKKSGCYGDVKKDLRDAIVCIFRERLRKDTAVVPGRPLSGEARERFFAEAYAYLKSTLVEVLDDTCKQPGFPVPSAPEAQEKNGQNGPGSGSGGSRRISFGEASAWAGGYEAEPSVIASSPPAESEAPEEAASADMVNPTLAESVSVRRARSALAAATEPGERLARLADECEMMGRWDRAARLLQSRLLLDAYKSDPKVWVDYAKFCMRARGRQASAEEALRQAVQLLAEADAAPAEEEAEPSPQAAVAEEVDLMLACLLLDRGRHVEAVRVFSEWHQRDQERPIFCFLLGLAHYLAGEEETLWRPLLTSVQRSDESSEGLEDEASPQPYVECLQRLLDFGLPSLVFTFLDQCSVLTPEMLAKESIALLDAKASALERQYEVSVQRLQPVLAMRMENGKTAATQESWRLSAECHFQLHDFEKALPQLQQALSFEARLTDPEIYIRWGHILLSKKRWNKAREAFLRAIHCKPTAEAWSGIGVAAYRSEDRLRECYEALREASLLDDGRADIWAQLVLVHLRLENSDLAEHCFKRCVGAGPDSDDLLLEVAAECIKRDTLPVVAEAAARLALQLHDSWQGHAHIAEILANRSELANAVQEAQTAVRLLYDQPELAKPLFERALRWSEELGDEAVSESLRATQQELEQEQLEQQRLREAQEQQEQEQPLVQPQPTGA